MTRVALGQMAVIPPAPPLLGPYVLAISPRDGRVWIGSLEGQDVRVYDPSSGVVTLAHTLAPGRPVAAVFSQNGSRLWLPLQGGAASDPGQLLELDPGDGSAPSALLERTTLPCSQPNAALLLDDDYLAVLCEGDGHAAGTLLRVTLASRVFEQVATGPAPDGVGLIAP